MANPLRDPKVTEHLADDELFLYDDAGQELTVLNKTALLIWSLCDGNHSEKEIVRLMGEIYPDAGGEAIASDVAATLSEFRDKGLTHTQEGS